MRLFLYWENRELHEDSSFVYFKNISTLFFPGYGGCAKENAYMCFLPDMQRVFGRGNKEVWISERSVYLLSADTPVSSVAKK